MRLSRLIYSILLLTPGLAMAQAAPAQNGFLSFAPIIFVFVIGYFLILRPQIKRQKELQNTINSIAKGSEVITVGGILGTVTDVQEGYISIKIANDVEVKCQKNAVATVLPAGTIKAI